MPLTCTLKMVSIVNFFKFYSFFERQKESVSRVEAEREGDTESEAGSRLRAVWTEPDVGLEFMNLETVT